MGARGAQRPKTVVIPARAVSESEVAAMNAVADEFCDHPDRVTLNGQVGLDRSRRRFVPPFIHVIPDLLRDSVPLRLKNNATGP